MDLNEILEEQLNQVVDSEALNQLTRDASQASYGLTDSFTLESILDSTLQGQNIFQQQVLIESLKDLVLYEIQNALILSAEILLICIFIGILSNFVDSFEGQSVATLANLVCNMVIIGIAINSFKIAYQLCIDTVSVMVNSMELLMPVLFTILISTGQITSGTILNPLMMGTITGFSVIIKKIILPALFLSTSLALINCLTEKNYVNRLSKLIREASLISIGLILAVLSGIISVQKLISETSDGLILNTAKYSLSTFIPIVGGFTADTIELYLNCMTSIKGILGVFGILVLICISIVPILKILIIAIIYKLSGALIEPISESKIGEGLNEMGNNLISIASVILLTSLMFLIFLSMIIRIDGGV